MYSPDIVNSDSEFIVNGRKFKVNSIRFHTDRDEGVKADIDASLIRHGNTNFTSHALHDIDRVIFNGPATIVFWKDGTKTVVKCSDRDHYDKRTAIMWAIMKKTCGNISKVKKIFDNLIDESIVFNNEDPINVTVTLDNEDILNHAVKSLINSIYGTNENRK